MSGCSILVMFILLAVIVSSLIPTSCESIKIRLRKKKIRYAAQAASALALLGKPKKMVFPLPIPVPLPIPIITKHDPVIHPIDPL